MQPFWKHNYVTSLKDELVKENKQWSKTAKYKENIGAESKCNTVYVQIINNKMHIKVWIRWLIKGYADNLVTLWKHGENAASIFQFNVQYHFNTITILWTLITSILVIPAKGCLLLLLMKNLSYKHVPQCLNGMCTKIWN